MLTLRLRLRRPNISLTPAQCLRLAGTRVTTDELLLKSADEGHDIQGR